MYSSVFGCHKCLSTFSLLKFKIKPLFLDEFQSAGQFELLQNRFSYSCSGDSEPPLSLKYRRSYP